MTGTTDYTTDIEYQWLMRGILENPKDDACRLILSDWLEEHGEEERAAMIRSMIAVWNDDAQNTLTHKQHEHHDEVIQSWLTNRQWGLELEKLFGWNWSRENCATWYQWDLRRDVRATWVRGFISEVRLTCAEFCGHQCERCNGSGTLYGHSFHPPCRLCSGTGRIEGVARALFERHPITRVVLTDRKPLHFPHNYYRDCVYWWHMTPTATTRLLWPDYVPDVLRKYCFGQTNASYDQLAYRIEAAALSALSDACVRYGRELVGLPPLS